jgi:hypothetical protein
MKKGLWFVVFNWWMIAASANDTLTRAQVYNFNVGDTFDYRQSFSGGSFLNVSYLRKIVSNIYHSVNLDTLYITYQGGQLETLTSLQDYEILLQGGLDVWCNNEFSADTNSIYNHRTLNSFRWQCSEPNSLDSFVAGLGNVYHRHFFIDQNDVIHTSITQLIYFSQAGETWGTPMEAFTGFNEIRDSQSDIRILPNPATTSLTIQSENPFPPQTTFQLFDLSGRMVLQQELSAKTTRVELVDVSSGMYLYNVVEGKGKVKSGKLVIE